jgi:hypothetical protein
MKNESSNTESFESFRDIGNGRTFVSNFQDKVASSIFSGFFESAVIEAVPNFKIVLEVHVNLPITFLS